MSRNCENENDWLCSVKKYLQRILADPDAYVEFWSLEEEEGITATKIMELAVALCGKVDFVMATPLNQRVKREW